MSKRLRLKNLLLLLSCFIPIACASTKISAQATGGAWGATEATVACADSVSNGALYTGLIVDASHLSDVIPSLAPKIRTEDGQIVYGARIFSTPAFREVLVQEGVVEYAQAPVAVDTAKTHPRYGANPLIVRAVGISPGRALGLIVSRSDAERIWAANSRNHFLEKARVVIVLHPKAASGLSAEEGEGGLGEREVSKDSERDIPSESVSTNGSGIPASKDAPVEIQKQEAFVAAVVDGVGNMIEIRQGVTFDETIVGSHDDPDSDSVIEQAVKGVVGEFEIDRQTIVFNRGLVEDAVHDVIHCTYKGQKIIVINGQLRFPNVELLDFPGWQNPPETISGISIEGVVSHEDGSMDVKLSFELPESAEQ